jgi:hypothetical protein
VGHLPWLRRLPDIAISFGDSLPSLLSKLAAPFKKFATPITPKDNTEKRGAGRQEQPPIIANIVPSPPSNDKSEKCRYPHTPWWKTTAEMLGIGAVIAYTIFSGFQMHYASQQARAAITASGAATQSLKTIQDQFVLDQRPYIVAFGFQMSDFKTGKPSPAIKGRPLVVNIQIKNVGKSAALNTIVHRHLLFGEASIERMRVEPPDTRKSGDAIAQAQQYMTTAVSINDTFANETADIRPSELVNWDGTKPIIVFGRITYEDSFGNSYCTPFANRYFGPHMWENISQLWVESSGFTFKLTDLCPSKAF